MNLAEFKSSKIKGREEMEKKAIEAIKSLNPLAIHQFGSGGRGTMDEFSDLDFFATMKDEDFEKAVEVKVETWSKVGPILLRLYNKIPNPAGWYQDTVMYKTDKGLAHVDYYLTPESKVVLPPNARLLYGKDFPPGSWETWTIKAKTDTAGHDLYEGILFMSYIGVKGIVRKWDNTFFDFLRQLYNGYRRDNNPNVPELPEDNNFELINEILGNLKKEGNERQLEANKLIHDFNNQVAQLYK